MEEFWLLKPTLCQDLSGSWWTAQVPGLSTLPLPELSSRCKCSLVQEATVRNKSLEALERLKVPNFC